MIFGVLSTAGGIGSGAVSPSGSALISSTPDGPRLSSCSAVCTGAGSSSGSARSGSTSFLCWGRGRTLIFLAGCGPARPSALVGTGFLGVCGSDWGLLKNWGLSELLGLLGWGLSASLGLFGSFLGGWGPSESSGLKGSFLGS